MKNRDQLKHLSDYVAKRTKEYREMAADTTIEISRDWLRAKGSSFNEIREEMKRLGIWQK